MINMKQRNTQKWLSLLLVVLMLFALAGCSEAETTTAGGGNNALAIDYVSPDGTVQPGTGETSSNGAEASWFAQIGSRLTADKQQAGQNSQAESGTGGLPAQQDNTTGAQQPVDEGTGADEQQKDGQTGQGDAVNQQLRSTAPATTGGEVSEDSVNDNVESGSESSADASQPESLEDESSGPDEPSSKEEESTTQEETKENTIRVTMHIRCDTAVANGMHLESQWAGIVPASGVILPATQFEVEEGSTAFDVLCLARDQYKFHMQYNGSDSSAYIQGINNLYEFDGGPDSGWMFSVNGWYPNYGCGAYVLSDGDSIEWNYTCDLGKDLEGAAWMG